ncbi:hypothetical protein, partial [Acinetobacter baumannii]
FLRSIGKLAHRIYLTLRRETKKKKRQPNQVQQHKTTQIKLSKKKQKIFHILKNSSPQSIFLNTTPPAYSFLKKPQNPP